jgi:hypothetical protein
MPLIAMLLFVYVVVPGAVFADTWKRHTEPQYSFHYPSSWQLSRSDTQIQVMTTADGGVLVSFDTFTSPEGRVHDLPEMANLFWKLPDALKFKVQERTYRPVMA